MKVAVSLKRSLKKEWKKYYFMNKLRRVFGEIPFWSRVKFVFFGHF